MESVLHELLSFTVYHVSHEETDLADNSYPNFAQHKEEHARFLRKVKAIYYDYEKMDRGSFQGIIEFITGWLINHIFETGVEFVQYAGAGNT